MKALACLAWLIALGFSAVAPAGAAAPRPGTTFRDCADCSEMIVVPAGHFFMGSSEAEKKQFAASSTTDDEGPQHEVTIAKPFAIGRFEVTRGQYAAFVQDTGYKGSANCTVWNGRTLLPTAGRDWDHNVTSTTDNQPVVCTTWNDMTLYIAWLSRRTGKHYRLPSSAEWEYAARAGTKTLYFFGDDPNDLCRYGNVDDRTVKEQAKPGDDYTGWEFADCRDGYGAVTAPVGSFRPNAFGLYDTIGNVWERVADCHHADYVGAPKDGSAWTGSGDCSHQTIRGAGWRNKPSHYRSANQSAGYPIGAIHGQEVSPYAQEHFQGDYLGFRLVRDLD